MRAIIMALRNYIIKHWRGELPLRWAFGVNVFGLHALYRGIELAGQQFLMSEIIVPFTLFMGLLRFITAVWQVIGIWRTTGFYIARQKLVPFAYFLRGLILFGYVWTAGRFLVQA